MATPTNQHCRAQADIYTLLKYNGMWQSLAPGLWQQSRHFYSTVVCIFVRKEKKNLHWVIVFILESIQDNFGCDV